ncbi:MAG: ATPase, T2SS/T4P/T4SS family [Actinomycetota bacterium]|nr:ATPase, T2SS/T4P/T4SS family [Actinomycetota bacterium]
MSQDVSRTPRPSTVEPLYWKLGVQRQQAADALYRDQTASEIIKSDLTYAEKRRRIEEIAAKQSSNFGIGANMAQQFAEIVTDDVLGLGGLETLIRDESVFNITIRWLDGEAPRVVLQRIGTNAKERFNYPLAPTLDAFREGIIGNKAIRYSGQPVNWTYASPHVTLYLPTHKVRIAANMLHDSKSILASVRMNQMGQPDLDEITQMRMVPSRGMHKFLKAMLASRANFLVVGSTGSGKTTLLRALLHSVDYYDCLYVVEDSPELDLDQRSDKHDLILPLVPTKERNMSALVRDSQRYMADRIVIGEALDDSIIDWFTVANVTGGSGLTLHTEEPNAVFRRIRNMCGEKLSETEVYERMAECVDIVVFVRHRQDRDPERQVENIWALTHHTAATDGKPVYAELWSYDHTLKKTVWQNVIPDSLQEKFSRAGVRLVPDESDARFARVGNRKLDPLLKGITDDSEPAPDESDGEEGQDPVSSATNQDELVARLFGAPSSKGFFRRG